MYMYTHTTVQVFQQKPCNVFDTNILMSFIQSCFALLSVFRMTCQNLAMAAKMCKQATS